METSAGAAQPNHGMDAWRADYTGGTRALCNRFGQLYGPGGGARFVGGALPGGGARFVGGAFPATTPQHILMRARRKLRENGCSLCPLWEGGGGHRNRQRICTAPRTWWGSSLHGRSFSWWRCSLHRRGLPCSNAIDSCQRMNLALLHGNLRRCSTTQPRHGRLAC